MNWHAIIGSYLALTGAACVIGAIIKRCAPYGYEDRDSFKFGKPVREIDLPHQDTQHLSHDLPERRGDGEVVGFEHAPVITNEVDR
jgi:hypothetical protein